MNLTNTIRSTNLPIVGCDGNSRRKRSIIERQHQAIFFFIRLLHPLLALDSILGIALPECVLKLNLSEMKDQQCGLLFKINISNRIEFHNQLSYPHFYW